MPRMPKKVIYNWVEVGVCHPYLDPLLKKYQEGWENPKLTVQGPYPEIDDANLKGHSYEPLHSGWN